MSRAGSFGDRRALSSVLALILLIGVVAVGSIGIILLGGDALTTERDAAENDKIRLAFQNLDTNIDTVARDDASARQVDVALSSDQGGAVRESEAGRIVVTRTNITAGNTDELVNRSIGAIVYAENDRHYAVQAGGVWQGTGNETQMVSAPPVSYTSTRFRTEPTLTIPIIETSGDRRLVDDQVRITHNATVSPLNDVTVVEGDLITVSITSRYYVGWGKYFSQITNEAAVKYDHANDTVIVQMIVPTVAPPVEGGVIMGATAETLDLKQNATVDSYNSSEGNYTTSVGTRGRVISAGDVRLKQFSEIHGNLEVGGDVRFEQDSRVFGNFSHEPPTSIVNHSDLSTHVTGWTSDNATVTDRTPVDGVIDRNVQLVRDSNDNGSTTDIANGQLQNCNTGSGCQLTAGAYYLTDLTLDGTDRLELDTSGGQIYIVVQNQFGMWDDAEIEVTGPGRVNVYVDGETGSRDFVMKHNATVTVPGQRAPGMWVYMDSDAEVLFRQQINFTGVVYGPGPGVDPGAEIRMSTNDRIHVFGAVVGDVAPITQKVRVHYDETLATETPVQTATSIPRLTFIHVSVYRVDVENGD